MPEKRYISSHTGAQIDTAITKALNPSTTFNSEDAGKLADAKAVGELVAAEKERAEATYLPYDGYSQLARVGEADVADNLTPYSGDSGTSQNTPFIGQGTGCANGEEQVDTGSYCQLQRKNGNTVTFNQGIQQLIGGSHGLYPTGFNTPPTMTDGLMSGSTITTFSRMGLTNHTFYKDHKYLWIFSARKTAGGDGYMGYHDGTAWHFKAQALTSNFQTLSFLWTVANDFTMTNSDFPFSVTANEADVSVSFEAKDFYLIDLTQYFGSNDKIPTHLLNHPEDFFRYYQGSLAYNAGTLTDSNGRYLTPIKRNQWDEQTELGYIDDTTGSLIPPTGDYESTLRSKNFCRCIPNTPYYGYQPSSKVSQRIYWYDKDQNYLSSDYIKNTYVTSPANAIFFKWALFRYGTTYNHDITISLYYEGESGYDQYYPYEELANVDTGSETLLAFDWKEPNGTIHCDTIKVNGFQSADVSNASIEDPSYTLWRITLTSTAPTYNKVNSYANMKCNKYEVVRDYQTAILSDKTIAISGTYGNNILLNDSSLTTAESVMTVLESLVLEIELNDASKTTEQGTPFPENVAIDDFGSMWFDCPNGVPQGNTIFYPVDYKASLDTLYNRVEGDMTKYVIDTEITDTALEARGYYKMQDLSSEISLAIGLTSNACRAYRTGNMVILDIQFKNSTGSTISADTVFATVGSNLKPVSGKVSYGIVSSTNAMYTLSNEGTVTCSISIPDQHYTYVTFAYAVN